VAPSASAIAATWDLPTFGGLSEADVRRVVQSGEALQVNGGDVIVREGEVGSECYVLLRGRAMVSRRGRRLAELGPGDHFGELAALRLPGRTATVTMRTEGRLLALDAERLAAMLETSPALARWLLHRLARRLHEAETRALDAPVP
jgi:CRP-like cAMP-binding protein